MRKLAIQLIKVHTVVLLLSGIGVWYIMHLFFPDLLINTFFIVPLFFYILGLIFILILKKIPLDQPKRMVNLYMLLRVFKLFVSAILIAIYWFLNRDEIRSFAMVFIVFYLIYLIVETYIYTKVELFIKSVNRKDKKKKEIQ